MDVFSVSGALIRNLPKRILIHFDELVEKQTKTTIKVPNGSCLCLGASDAKPAKQIRDKVYGSVEKKKESHITKDPWDFPPSRLGASDTKLAKMERSALNGFAGKEREN